MYSEKTDVRLRIPGTLLGPGLRGLVDQWEAWFTAMPDPDVFPSTWTADIIADFRNARDGFRQLFLDMKSYLSRSYPFTVEGIQGMLDFLADREKEILDDIQWKKFAHRTRSFYMKETNYVFNLWNQAKRTLAAELIAAKNQNLHDAVVSDADGGAWYSNLEFSDLIRPPLVYVVGGVAALFLFSRK